MLLHTTSGLYYRDSIFLEYDLLCKLYFKAVLAFKYIYMNVLETHIIIIILKYIKEGGELILLYNNYYHTPTASRAIPIFHVILEMEFIALLVSSSSTTTTSISLQKICDINLWGI